MAMPLKCFPILQKIHGQVEILKEKEKQVFYGLLFVLPYQIIHMWLSICPKLLLKFVMFQLIEFVNHHNEILSQNLLYNFSIFMLFACSINTTWIKFTLVNHSPKLKSNQQHLHFEIPNQIIGAKQLINLVSTLQIVCRSFHI